MILNIIFLNHNLKLKIFQIHPLIIYRNFKVFNIKIQSKSLDSKRHIITEWSKESDCSCANRYIRCNRKVDIIDYLILVLLEASKGQLLSLTLKKGIELLHF